MEIICYNTDSKKREEKSLWNLLKTEGWNVHILGTIFHV